MPVVDIRVDASRLTATLDRITPDVKSALERALKPLAAEIAADARTLAEAHIRFLGKRPGQYLASIAGGTFSRGDRIGGYVRSANPLAHLLEFGATTPAHDIFPSVAGVLAFDGDAGQVFAAHVHSPGATIPPYPAIEPAFAARENDIIAALESAAKGAVS